MTLKERITSVLVCNGFAPAGSVRPSLPGFLVTPGVGAIVEIAWIGASGDERDLLLAKYANRLRSNGLTVTHRDSYLYVAEPGTAGEAP